MDVMTKEQRHKNMQAIRSKDTKPEGWYASAGFQVFACCTLSPISCII